jgi:hypothetical protein
VQEVTRARAISLPWVDDASIWDSADMWATADLGVPGRGDAHVGQQRRVDATGELPQVLQRLCGVRCHLVQQRFRLSIVVLQRLRRQPELAGQSGQLPLRAVADVAFQPPTFPVLRGDQAFAWCSVRSDSLVSTSVTPLCSIAELAAASWLV